MPIAIEENQESDLDFQIPGNSPEMGHTNALVELSSEGAMILQEILEAAPGRPKETTMNFSTRTYTLKCQTVTYPRDVASEVAALRPDLVIGDGVAAVLTADPSLSAEEVIEVLEEAAKDHAAEIDRLLAEVRS